MTHIIRQQYLHVEVNGTESDGLALQRSLPDVCRNWLMPALERVLERCVPSDRHWYIERLDIDAGTLALERLEHDLAEAVAQAVEKSLREHISRSQSSSSLISGNVQQRTVQLSIIEAFVYFLRTGSLPWSFRLPEGRNLEEVVLDSWQEAVQSSSYSRTVIDAVLQVLVSATARKRLVRQFSSVFLETVLALLAPEGKKVVEAIFQILHSATEPPVETTYFERLLWEMVFTNVAIGKVLPAMSLVGEAWRAVPSTTAGYTALAAMLERHWPGVTNKALGTTTEEIPISIDEHPEARVGIYVDNAGIVLLHPFLPQFFAALGIAVDDTLVQPDRALCLLHFLTTGQSVAPEYELILPKFLCNLPLGTAVESDVKLTDLEKEEALALLEAVIRHWEVLRNTSPDGLRGTFLLRPGKVSLRDDGDWLLQVEAKAYDLLLDQLPWGISMIKLPWMDKMLWVEWR